MWQYKNINVGKIRQRKSGTAGVAQRCHTSRNILKIYRRWLCPICTVGQRKMKRVDLGLKSFASPLCLLSLLTSNNISYSICSFDVFYIHFRFNVNNSNSSSLKSRKKCIFVMSLWFTLFWECSDLKSWNIIRDEFKIILDEDSRDLSTISNIARRVKCRWLSLTSFWLEREKRGMNRVPWW